jgi:hypothetical protein
MFPLGNAIILSAEDDAADTIGGAEVHGIRVVFVSPRPRHEDDVEAPTSN